MPYVINASFVADISRNQNQFISIR